MAELFRELEQRFLVGSVKDPLCFYVSLGKKERWTVNVTPETCEVVAGKTGGDADCVLKTSPAMFTRIVREGWHSYWEWSTHAHDDGAGSEGGYQARRAREQVAMQHCALTSASAPCPR